MPRGPTSRASDDRGETAVLRRLGAAAGNRALARLLTTSDHHPIQRLTIDENDWKLSGKDIWKKYTPDKDEGAQFLVHLSAQGNSQGTIDTADLTGKYKKIGDWLAETLNRFKKDTDWFFGSTLNHANDEKRYPEDNDKTRYIEYGIKGVGQTRLVVDTKDRKVYISTHYESPHVIKIAGSAPATVLGLADTHRSWL